MEPILKGRGLVKRYGKVTALDHCDFDLMPGEILAVIGDNGAGKSALIKAISAGDLCMRCCIETGAISIVEEGVRKRSINVFCTSVR